MHYSKKQLLFPSLLFLPADAPADYVSYCLWVPVVLYCTAVHSAFLQHWPKQKEHQVQNKFIKQFEEKQAKWMKQVC